MDDLWEDLLAAIFGALWEIKQELWDTVSGMYFETLYSYFDESAGPLSDAFSALVMASYVGVVVAAGIIILSHETLQTRYSLREMLPRLVIAILLVGLVGEITWQVYATHMSLADAFTLSDRVNSVTCENFPDGSAAPINPAECEGHESVMRSEFANHASMVATGPDADKPVGLVDIGMQLVSIWIYVTLVVIFLMRNIAWFCVLIMAPLALACHSLPQLERFAHYWWRLLGACLASSIGQCALIWIYHHLDGTVQFDHSGEVKYIDDYNFLLFYLVLITWLMWKLHKVAFQLARGKTTAVPGSGFLKYLLLNKLMNGRSHRSTSPSRRRRRSPSDDDSDGATPNHSRRPGTRPHRRYPESKGLREYAAHRNQADAFHAERQNAKPDPEQGQPTDSGSAPKPLGGPAPSPTEVAARVEHRKKVLEVPGNVRDHEQFRKRADAFHAHRAEIARRHSRDKGAVRKRDRSADAVDLLADDSQLLRHRGVEVGGGRTTPRRAQDRLHSTMMPRDHRGDPGWVLTIPPYRDTHDAAAAGETGSASAPETGEGGERS